MDRTNAHLCCCNWITEKNIHKPFTYETNTDNSDFTSFISLANAQEDGDTLWTVSGLTSLNFSQLSLTNWAAGGENSMAGNAIVNLSANYQSRDSQMNWDNNLIMGYGMVKQEGDDTKKSDDKIDLFSNYIKNPQYVDVNFDFMLNFKVNKFISASFVSQIIYDYDIQIADDAGIEKDRIQFKELFGLGLTYSF
jgi:hypothetical protein